MAKPILIIGLPGSGKTQRAVEEAARRGNYVTISFEQFIGRFRPWLAGEPDVVIVDEVPGVGDWPRPSTIVSEVRHILNNDALWCEQQGKDGFPVKAPRFILVSCQDLTCRPGWGNQEFKVIALGRGGAGRGQGNKVGHRRTADPKRKVLSQRYTDTDVNLINSVADGKVGEFIHDAAVDRARQFAEQEGICGGAI